MEILAFLEDCERVATEQAERVNHSHEAAMREVLHLDEEAVARKYQMKKDERRGGYDEQKCDARIWFDGWDDVQCSFNKKGGCFCKRHQNLSDKNGGVWWLGKINKPRPENPHGPPHLPEMRNGRRTHVRIHKWN